MSGRIPGVFISNLPPDVVPADVARALEAACPNLNILSITLVAKYSGLHGSRCALVDVADHSTAARVSTETERWRDAPGLGLQATCSLPGNNLASS